MKKYNYTYITTNLITGKQYVGDHSTDNINDEYLGSGEIIKKSIKKYGKEKFEKEILESFETKQEAFNAQEKYIIEYNTLNPNGYNISPKGGHNVKGCISTETKKKIGDGNRGKIISNETRNKISEKMLGKNNPMYRYKYSDEQLVNFSRINKEKNNPMWGKKLSDEHKNMISIHQTGRIKSEDEKLKISLGNKEKFRSDDLKKQISLKLKGTKKSEETKQKMRKPKTAFHRRKISESNKGKKLSSETKKKISDSLKRRKRNYES